MQCFLLPGGGSIEAAPSPLSSFRSLPFRKPDIWQGTLLLPPTCTQENWQKVPVALWEVEIQGNTGGSTVKHHFQLPGDKTHRSTWKRGRC